MSKPEPSVETPEQIVNRWRKMNVKISRYLYESPAAVAQLCEMIEAALRARDARAVRIIQEHQDSEVCKDNCWTTIKAAIREGKGD